MKNLDTKVDETINELYEGKIDVDGAVNFLLDEGKVVAGGTVAVIADPTYPFDGAKGKVKKVLDSGYAEVEFPNGSVAKLMTSLLLPQ